MLEWIDMTKFYLNEALKIISNNADLVLKIWSLRLKITRTLEFLNFLEGLKSIILELKIADALEVALWRLWLMVNIF